MSRRNVIKYDRTRRKRHWSLGTPPQSKRRRRWSGPRRYLKMVAVLGAVAFLGLPYGADAISLVAVQASADGCRVARVIDGDTVTLWCPETGWERTRILGLDTPEKFSPGCAREFAAAVQAEWALRRIIFEAEILSVELHGLDRYDRRLARLFLDGEDVARTMTLSGHARAYRGGLREGWCA